MATVLDRPDTPPPSSETPALLKRPHGTEGFWGWITTIDHKRIGVLYGTTAFVFFLIGGVEALLIRMQLAQPNGTLLSADAYNQLFTMHGTTMVFLVIMPLSAAFFNFLTPLMIGARDVAFPRLNAFSYWTFLFGGILLYSSFLLGGAADGGWFGYPPNTSVTFAPGHGIDFWVVSLLILGIASTVGAANFITTILNMRAPGMTLMRMPIFVWMTLVSSFLILFAMPVITVALVLLMFDRLFGANFFNAAAGGDPLLWQHLFWLFGHPEVYILILPSMGMVSEVLPVFSRKPLFGYPVVVFSGIAIGFMGWGVWVHHMFSTGLGPIAIAAFSVSTMLIAVPTGVKIFNWLGTMWGGQIRFHTPMLFAVGFVGMFTIGGLSGVTHALAPHDRQQTDTYYIVAHFHYVLFGGALLGIFAGVYYWWPKVFGRMLSDRLGKINFWTMLIGFNLAFAPMHWIGLQGLPRRTYTYDESLGVGASNMLATVGAFVIALGVLVFIYNVWWSTRRGLVAAADPWDARTLEWSIPSPAPHYNFAEIPVVHDLDDYWHRKYTEDAHGRLVRIETPEEAAGEEEQEQEDREDREDREVQEGNEEHEVHVHLPTPSFFPLVASAGLPVMGYGIIYKVYPVVIVGALILLAGLYAWAIEPADEPEPEPPAEEPASEEPVLVGAPTPELEAGTGEGDEGGGGDDGGAAGEDGAGGSEEGDD